MPTPNTFPIVAHQPRAQEGAPLTAYDGARMNESIARAVDYFQTAVPMVSGFTIKDAVLDYTIVNLIEHKLGRAYRGWLVVRRQVPPCRFKATTPSTTSLPDATKQTLDMSVEEYDDGGDHSAGIFTAPIDGIYQFEAQFRISSVLAANNAVEVTLSQNGTTTDCGRQDVGTSALAPSPTIQCGCHTRLVAGDTIRATAYKDEPGAAANATIDTVGTSTWFKGWLVDEGLTEDKDWIDAGGDVTKYLPIRCSFDQTVSLWVF